MAFRQRLVQAGAVPDPRHHLRVGLHPGPTLAGQIPGRLLPSQARVQKVLFG